MIVLGDQSPWVGGLLRWKALRDAGEETKYFLADLDSPILNVGSETKIKTVSGWPPYWALGVRYPWTIDCPEMDVNAGNTLRQSLTLPSGLKYLGGGHRANSKTLHASDRDNDLLHELERLLVEEQRWALRLSRFFGNEEDQGNEALVGQVSRGSVMELTRCLAARLGLSEIESELGLFKRERCLSRSVLPREYFWEIRDGFRLPLTSDISQGVIVPRGKALPLEFALRGWETGCTNLPYLDDTQRLRDRYYPGLPLAIVRVVFDWDQCAVLDALVRQFAQRKRKRAESNGSLFDPKVVTAAQNLTQQAASYWRSRPSVITYLTLGGALNPTIIRETL